MAAAVSTPLRGGEIMEYVVCFAFLVMIIVFIIKK